MQYQVSKDDVVVAWIDTEKEECVIKDGYEIRSGEELFVEMEKEE